MVNDFWINWTTTRNLTIDLVMLFLVLLSTLIVGVLFKRHLLGWRRDLMQKCYLRVVLMVPAFAWFSFFSLLHPGLAVFCEIPKGLYEAYALWAFFWMMTVYAGGEARVVCMYEEFGGKFTCLGCCTCCTYKSGEELMRINKRNIIQFLYVRPLIAGILAGFEVVDFNNAGAVLILKVINMGCTILVVQTIINAYLATIDHMFGFGAAKKLLFIKFIVGLAVLQEMIITLLVSAEIIKDSGSYTAIQVGTRMVACLLIAEQVFMALLALWAYGHHDISLNKEALEISYPDGFFPEGENVSLTQSKVHPCYALRMTFRFWDLFGVPIEERQSGLQESKEITHMADPEFQDASANSQSAMLKREGPSILESSYNDF